MKSLTAFHSAIYIADQNYDGTSDQEKGCIIIIDVTLDEASASVTFTLQGFDRASGKYYTILASAAIVGTGTTILRVYPGLTAAGNLVATDIMPKYWRINANHVDADAMTYSVGIHLVD